MSARIEDVVNSYHQFLERRKKELHQIFEKREKELSESDTLEYDSEAEKEKEEAERERKELSESDALEYDSEAEREKEEIEREQNEFDIIEEQLCMITRIPEELSKFSLSVSEPGLDHMMDPDNPRLFHEIQKFINNLMLVSHNKILHLKISSAGQIPSTWELLDYIKNNGMLRTLSIERNYFMPSFIHHEEFPPAFNSAPHLFYIYIELDEETHEIIEPFDSSKVTAEKIGKGLAFERAMILFINEEAHQREIIFFKKQNSERVNWYARDRDKKLKKLRKKTFFEKIENPKTFTFKLILRGIFSEIIRGNFREKEDTTGRCIINDIKIDGAQKFRGWHLVDYAACYNHALIAQYLVMNGVDLGLKNDDGDTPFLLAAQHADSNMLHILFEISYPLPDGNIELTKEKKGYLEYTDKMGNTPLLSAVGAGKVENVKFLLKVGSNIKHENSLKRKAIDIAFEKEDWECILILLKAGSPFPNGFDSKKLSKEAAELREFIKLLQDYTGAIEKGNMEIVLQGINENKITPTFRNQDNHSAPYIAFSNKQYEVYALLRSRGFSMFDHEFLGSETLNKTEKDRIKFAMITFVNKSSFSTITYLLSRSRILQTDPRHFEFIRQIYSDLTAIPEIQIILEVLEYSPMILDIIFDFESDNIQDVSGSGGVNTAGSCNYKEGRIYIGAKVDRFELLGTIAHEFTHQAMQVIFENDCSPYYVNNDIDIKRIKEVIAGMKDRMDLDPIIRRVFTVYKEQDWPAEIIVRVPHVLAKYNLHRGNSILKEQAENLLEFYRHIQKKCEDFILKKRKSPNSKYELETRLSLKDEIDLGAISTHTLVSSVEMMGAQRGDERSNLDTEPGAFFTLSFNTKKEEIFGRNGSRQNYSKHGRHKY